MVTRLRGWIFEESWFDLWQGKVVSHFSKASRQAVYPTCPHLLQFNGYLGLFPGVKAAWAWGWSLTPILCQS